MKNFVDDLMNVVNKDTVKRPQKPTDGMTTEQLIKNMERNAKLITKGKP